MLYIDQVEKGKDVHGCEVITHVYWTNVLTEKASKKCTKREMINFINNMVFGCLAQRFMLLTTST